MTPTPPVGHALFGCSSFSRWSACPAAHRENLNAPRTSSRYAEEGTLAAKVLEECLKTGLRDASRYLPKSGEIPADMVDAVQVALDYVYSADRGAPSILSERRVHIPTPSAPGSLWGTADVFLLGKNRNSLEVIDYKHGAGVAVEVDGSWGPNAQLMAYAAGMLWDKQDGFFPEAVRLTIIQPRCFHREGPIRSVVVPLDDVLDWAEKADLAIQACLAPEAPYVPGTSQCRWCAVKVTCQAHREYVLRGSPLKNLHPETWSAESLSVPQDPTHYDPSYLAGVLSRASDLRAWLTACEGIAEEMALAGARIPGFKLVEARGRRAWFGDHAALAARIAELAGVPLESVYPRELIGVSKAEALLSKASKGPAGAKTSAAVEMAYMTKNTKSDKLSLVPETDRRPEAEPGAKEFAGCVDKLRAIEKPLLSGNVS